MSNRTRSAFALALIASTFFASSANGGGIDPRGIYHNAFTGSFSGTEWFQVFPIAGTDRYRIADLFSGGFNGTITPGGAVTLDGGIGGGSFSNADDWIISPNLGGTVFTFDNVRAPDTDADFPLQLVSPAPANPLLSGQWQSLTQQLNPRTGALLGGGTEGLTITSAGTTFRITDPGGLFFQGVFESPNNIGFRVVVPTPSDTRFRTFPGSAINFTQNMLGQATIEDINNWSAIILLQSRTPLGSQTQLAFRFTATRTNPLPAGDLDGDRVVDETDRVLLESQLGNTAMDDAFNIAADLNGDDAIDAADVAAFNLILPPPECPGDCDMSGSVNFGDLVAMLGEFGNDTGPGCNPDGTGGVNFGDLVAALSLFGPCE